MNKSSPAPHTCTKHEPGHTCYTDTRARHHPCRCADCRRLATRYQKLRRLYGSDLIDASETREHVRKLACVMTSDQITAATGYSRVSIKRLLDGTTHRVRATTAEALLSVPLAVTPERRGEVVLEEVQHLLGTDTPRSIAQRLGYSRPDSLARLLERHGRRDLAALFDRRVAA